jgi:hypothetical protein
MPAATVVHRIWLLAAKENFRMPTELVSIGGFLVAAAGGLMFVLLRRRKPVEPPHFR